MKITTETLKSMGAYDEQVWLFQRLYPDGLELPDSGQERKAVLDVAARAGLDVAWWLWQERLGGIVRRWTNGNLRCDKGGE